MKQVVIADDNVLVVKALCETIPWKTLDMHIAFTSTSGKKTMEYIRNHSVDLLITDIKMPDLSGLDCIRQLLSEGYHFVSIIITGFGEFEYARQALLLGATDIILKPIDNQTLIIAICRAFQIPYTPKIKEKNAAEISSSVTPKSYTCKVKQKIVSQAIQYMQEHLSQKITLNDLADYLNVSRSHLSRCFREEYQKSFQDLYNDLRIQAAIEYLQTGQYRISEIANKVGFDNYACFYQFFKKYTGKSPKEFL